MVGVSLVVVPAPGKNIKFDPELCIGTVPAGSVGFTFPTLCRIPVNGPMILDPVIPGVVLAAPELKRAGEIIVILGKTGPMFGLPMPIRTIGGRPNAGVANPKSIKQVRINASVGLKIVCMIPLFSRI
jgi:hypothetical protein